MVAPTGAASDPSHSCGKEKNKKNKKSGAKELCNRAEDQSDTRRAGLFGAEKYLLEPDSPASSSLHLHITLSVHAPSQHFLVLLSALPLIASWRIRLRLIVPRGDGP